MALAALAYYAFEHEVWRRFRARIASGEFELVHRITPVSPTNQSLIAAKVAKRGIPFILGPINGGIPWPKGFAERQVAEREWLSSLRGLYKLLPGYRSTLAGSAAIIAGSSHVWDALPAWVADKRVFIPENAVDLARFNGARLRKAAIPLRAIFVGRLVPYKGADLLIEASAPFQRQGLIDLTIVGDGPDRGRLEALAATLGVERSTRFDGWTPHEQIAGKLLQSDLLALPSVREFGGGVVLEAMAMGVAPVVANYGGPADLIDDCVGLRVPFTDKASLIEGFTRALADCLDAPGRLDAMGAAGRAKVLSDFTWDAKAKQILEVYEASLANAPLSSLGLPRPSLDRQAPPPAPIARSA